MGWLVDCSNTIQRTSNIQFTILLTGTLKTLNKQKNNKQVDSTVVIHNVTPLCRISYCHNSNTMWNRCR